MMLVSLSFVVSCSFFEDFFADGDKKKAESEKTEEKITSLKLDKSKLSLKVGSIDYISIIYKPNDAKFEPSYTYDESKIKITANNSGVVVEGLEEGQTQFTVSCGNCSATCIISVSGYEANYEKVVEPYIYSNTNILQLSPGLSEKVFVSLYGGSVADINDYTWTVEDGTVCKVEPTGQYGLIKALSSGYTRIKVTHTKAAYPYYMGVYVFEDPSKATYITTSDNIVTMMMDGGDQTISVNLINNLETSRDDDFRWELITESSETVSDESEKNEKKNPISYVSNGNKAVITPVSSGYCTLRITHPDAVYPLDILCRVVTVVKNVYIEPDNTIVTLNGDSEKKVTSRLINIEPDEYSYEGYEYKIENTEVAEIIASVGESVYVRGKKNGSTKLIIKHSKAFYSREVLLVSSNQIADAIDASCYITTSDNYIRTKEGAELSEVNVMLKGGEEGDECNFTWTVENYALDGSSDNVIKLETTTGDVEIEEKPDITGSRKANPTYAYGKAYITPLKEGSAVIKVTHPKVLYPTEILVKVLSKDAILTEPLYFKGDGLVRILNGNSYNYTVSLNGASKKSSDISDITWSVNNSKIVVNGNEDKAEIKAPSLGSGSTVSQMKISHPKVEVPKSVVIITADDEETLMNMKVFFTDKNYYNIEVGSELCISVNTYGFDKTYDFSKLQWFVDRAGIIDFECNEKDRRSVKITALKSGTAQLKASLEGCECTFTISVYPVDAVHTEPEIYFTTSTNVVHIDRAGENASTFVSAINLPSSEYQNIKWNCEDSSIAQVMPNGTYCVITGISEGQTIINVQHPDSQNTLKIYVRVGSEYVQQSEEKESFVPYIKAPNVISLLTNDSPKKVQATLANYNGNNGEEFSWNIADENIAIFSALNSNGVAFVKGLKTGFTQITVSHKELSAAKNILVVVGETEAELIQMLSKSYMTTTNNVVAFTETGVSKVVKIDVFNIDNIFQNDITWKSSDESVCSVIGNGTSGTITANGNGKATVSVSYKDSMNTVIFYVYVGTEAINNTINNGENYNNNENSVIGINCENIVTIGKADSDKLFVATLTGYKGVDCDGFVFNIADSNIANIASQNSNGSVFIKPISVGYSEMTVTHKFTDVIKKVLIVVGETKAEAEEMLADIKYLSISNNVYSLRKGENLSVKISANNIDLYSSLLCKWSVASSSVITVTGNGTSAIVQGISAGEAVITITHPDCINSLQIYVFVFSADITESNITNTNPDVYISAQDVMLLQKDEQPSRLQAVLVNFNGTDMSGFSFTCDNPAVASITAQSANGSAFIKPVKEGQAEITISHTASSISKKVLVVVGNSAEELAEIRYLTTSNNVVSIGEGKTRNISVSVKNAADIVMDGFSWSSSNNNVADIVPVGATASVKANSVGTAIITVSHNTCKYPLQIIVHVVDSAVASAFPYIQLTSSVMVLNVGDSYSTISAELVGGSDDDNALFGWASSNNSICTVYGQNEVGKLKAVGEGTAIVTVSHPRADYSAQLLVVCEKKTQSECYISVPSSIINMKPTDSAMTITASLINGTANDKYNFKWQLDAYNVIDLQYAANVCTIKPKQAGTATIKINHPKAAYEQQIIVTVQEYTDFAFPNTNITVTQGDVKFLNMQVPFTSVKTHIEYNVKNSNVCSVSGTSQVAQITGVGKGSTVVTAKLVATNTNAVQATAELLVYVKERAVTDAYITSSSTICTVNKGRAQTLTAQITGTGITITDQNDLKWEISEDGSDVIEITGLKWEDKTDSNGASYKTGAVKGKSIYITAKKPGEAVITCSHEKASSDLQFYVVVPGTDKKNVSLNKSFINLVKGGTGVTLIANIENSESKDDYNNLTWTCTDNNGNSDGSNIARIMGSGKEVQIYPVSPGQVTVKAYLSESDSYAICTVTVEASSSFIAENTSLKVAPDETKEINLKVSPTNAIITWTRSCDDDYFSYEYSEPDSNGNLTLKVTGIKEGQGLILGTTDKGATVRITVKCVWSYDFKLDKTAISGKPGDKISIGYTVNPSNAKITVFSEDNCKCTLNEKSKNLTIEFLSEGKGKLTLSAVNPANSDIIGERTIQYNSFYDMVTLVPGFTLNDGKFSKFENGTIYVGDGETVSMSFSIKETNSSAEIKSISYEGTKQDFSSTDKSCSLKVCNDRIEWLTKVKRLYAPAYKGTVIPNWDLPGTEIFQWYVTFDTIYSWGNRTYKDYFGLIYKKADDLKLAWDFPSSSNEYPNSDGYYNASYADWAILYDDKGRKSDGNNFSLVEVTSMKGKIVDEEFIHQNPWLWCPGTPSWGTTDSYVPQEEEYYYESFGTGEQVQVEPHIISEHIQLEEVPTSNTNLKSINNAGKITVSIKLANGTEKSFEYPVVLQTYMCCNTDYAGNTGDEK